VVFVVFVIATKHLTALVLLAVDSV